MRRWRDVAPQWLPCPTPMAAAGHPRLNWTVRAGLWPAPPCGSRPRRAPLPRTSALLCPDYLRRRPALLSMDATRCRTPSSGSMWGLAAPRRAAPAHQPLGGRRLHRAYRVIAWSVGAPLAAADYGVPQQVEVLPRIDLSLWDPPDAEPARHTPPRLLFVGGDFQPKGRPAARVLPPLLAWPRRAAPGHARAPRAGAGRGRHSGLTPNAPALVRLFHRCDLFVLPTRGDTFARCCWRRWPAACRWSPARWAPSQVVVHGETGLLVPAGDAEGLFAAVRRSFKTGLRRQMGQAGRERVRERFNIPATAAAWWSCCTRPGRSAREGRLPLWRVPS